MMTVGSYKIYFGGRLIASSAQEEKGQQMDQSKKPEKKLRKGTHAWYRREHEKHVKASELLQTQYDEACRVRESHYEVKEAAQKALDQLKIKQWEFRAHIQQLQYKHDALKFLLRRARNAWGDQTVDNMMLRAQTISSVGNVGLGLILGSEPLGFDHAHKKKLTDETGLGKDIAYAAESVSDYQSIHDNDNPLDYSEAGWWEKHL